MNFEFDLAEKKLNKEREKRRQEAQKKINEQKLVHQQQKQREDQERQRKETQAKMKMKELEELEQNNGVAYKVLLKPTIQAEATLETDRIKLPPSVLENIVVKQDALSSNSSNPLVFELIVVGSSMNSSKELVHSTHAGVSDFTAEEGTIGLPMKTALSLTQNLPGGLQYFENESSPPTILLKYKLLDRYPKMKATFQPRGHGFHERGKNEVSIDLKYTLERVLQNHMVLTEGDIVPLRHNGKTFQLVVKKLEPERAVCIRDTEVEVVLLPSEVAEKEMEERRKEELHRKRLLEEETILRQQRRSAIQSRQSSPASADGQPSVNIQVRFGGGNTSQSNRIQSKFARNSPVRALFDWVSRSLVDVEPPIGALYKQRELGLDFEFQLVYIISPGNRLTLKPENLDQTLESTGISSSANLLVEYIDLRTEMPSSSSPATTASASASGDEMEIDIDEDASILGVGVWRKAFERAEKLTDNEIQFYNDALSSSADTSQAESIQLSENEKSRLLADLRSRNVTVFDALQAIQKYPGQLLELERMGFPADTRAIELLGKYQGRIERVVNVISEEQRTRVEQLQKQQEEILASHAITATAAAAMDTTEAEVESSFEDELRLLHEVGLTDDSRSVSLLRKYGRDVQRVINILLS